MAYWYAASLQQNFFLPHTSAYSLPQTKRLRQVCGRSAAGLRHTFHFPMGSWQLELPHHDSISVTFSSSLIRPIHHHLHLYTIITATNFFFIILKDHFEFIWAVFCHFYWWLISRYNVYTFTLICTLQCYLIANRMRPVTVLWIVHGMTSHAQIS